MQILGHVRVANEWKLFIDLSKISFKVVLLRNANESPSSPVGHVVSIKETYESMELILKVVNYTVCGDLKVISFLLELQRGSTKNIPVFGTAAMAAIITL